MPQDLTEERNEVEVRGLAEAIRARLGASNIDKLLNGTLFKGELVFNEGVSRLARRLPKDVQVSDIEVLEPEVLKEVLEKVERDIERKIGAHELRAMVGKSPLPLGLDGIEDQGLITENRGIDHGI